MRIAQTTQPLTIWQTNPVAAKTLTAGNTFRLTNYRPATGYVGTPNGDWTTGGEWYDIEIPTGAEFIQFQWESEIVNRGGFTGASAVGTCHCAVVAFGYAFPTGFTNNQVQTRTLSPNSAVAPIPKAKLRGCWLTCHSDDHVVGSGVTDDSFLMCQNGIIHDSIAPTNGDTVLINFWLARRKSLTTTVAVTASPSEGQALGIMGLSKISFSFGFNLGGAWNPASAADVLMNSRLSYALYNRTAT